ncbi:MFS transporter [Dactylosporangium sp. CA-092794]|uniref:MFS transporter n=1 Tax=Dactylosporangium sp. CA-092794 TaxID=3239929 RepID=UPI003D950380
MYLSTVDKPATAAAPAPVKARIAATVLALGAVSLITDVSAEMVTAILPLYLMLGLHLGPLGYGVVDGLYTGATALLRLVGGYLADRVRRRKAVAAVGYGISAVAKLGLLAAGSSVPLLSTVIIADRAGKGLRTAPRDALITLSTPPDRLGRAFGVHRAMDSAGAFAGPLVAVAVLTASAQSYDAVFVTSFCIALLGVFVLLTFVPDHRGPSWPAPTTPPPTPSRAPTPNGTAAARTRTATATATDPDSPTATTDSTTAAAVGTAPATDGTASTPSHTAASPHGTATAVAADGTATTRSHTATSPHRTATDADGADADPDRIVADANGAPAGRDDGGKPTARAALALLGRRDFRLVVLAATVMGLATIGDGFVYLVLQRHNDLAVGWFPLLAVGTNLAYLLLAVPAGHLADRIGRGRVYLAGFAALVAVYLILAAGLGGTGALVVTVALYGAFYAMTDGVLMAVAGPLLPEALKTTGIALVQSGQSLAYLASSVLFGAAWQLWGPGPALLAAAGTAVAALWLVASILLRGTTKNA